MPEADVVWARTQVSEWPTDVRFGVLSRHRDKSAACPQRIAGEASVIATRCEARSWPGATAAEKCEAKS